MGKETQGRSIPSFVVGMRDEAWKQPERMERETDESRRGREWLVWSKALLGPRAPEAPSLGAVSREAENPAQKPTLPRSIYSPVQPAMHPPADLALGLAAFVPPPHPQQEQSPPGWSSTGHICLGQVSPTSLTSVAPVLLVHWTSASPGPPTHSCILLDRPLRQTAEWGPWAAVLCPNPHGQNHSQCALSSRLCSQGSALKTALDPGRWWW